MRFLTRPLRTWNRRCIRPVRGLHLAVIFLEWVGNDLVDDRLDGLLVFRRVVLKDSGNAIGKLGGTTHDCVYALGSLAFPIGADQQAETRLRSIRLADLGELFGACVVERTDPKRAAKSRHSHHAPLFVKTE